MKQFLLNGNSPEKFQFFERKAEKWNGYNLKEK